MTKADLVSIISDKTGIIRKDVVIAVDSFFETVVGSLKEGKHIEIRGFGTFNIRKRKPHVGRNPKSGKKVEIPARITPTFKFSKLFKEEIRKANKDRL